MRVAELVETLTGERGHEHAAAVRRAARAILDGVGLVEHEQPRLVTGADLLEDLLDAR